MISHPFQTLDLYLKWKPCVRAFLGLLRHSPSSAPDPYFSRVVVERMSWCRLCSASMGRTGSAVNPRCSTTCRIHHT
jgi:hypothetical protein